MVEVNHLPIVHWSDLVGDMDDSNVEWFFTYGDATYTLVSRLSVQESIEGHLEDLTNHLEALIEDGAEKNDMASYQEEIAATKACLALLNTLPSTVLVAFDG